MNQGPKPPEITVLEFLSKVAVQPAANTAKSVRLTRNLILSPGGAMHTTALGDLILVSIGVAIGMTLVGVPGLFLLLLVGVWGRPRRDRG